MCETDIFCPDSSGTVYVVAAAASAIHADLSHHEWLQPDAQHCRHR